MAVDVRPPAYASHMMAKQQELPLPLWGGARKGAGRKRKSARRNVVHRTRPGFSRGALHVTTRVRQEVWNLRTHRCFRELRRALERGCARFGFRLIHFSVQGNHIHFIVEAPDQLALTRAMKGLEVRMARALNRVMCRRGPVFADRYHAHLLRTPREARNACDRALELACSRGTRRPARSSRRRPLQLSRTRCRGNPACGVLAAANRNLACEVREAPKPLNQSAWRTGYARPFQGAVQC